MYRTTSDHEPQSQPQTAPRSWRCRYAAVEEQAARTMLTPEEMQSMRWLFNYTPEAGGRGRSSVMEARFIFNHGLRLVLDGYSSLPCLLDASPSTVPDSHATGDSDDPENQLDVDFPAPAAAAALRQLEVVAACKDISQQRLIIANFPPHSVSRIDSTREWLITNQNVTFVSCHDADPTSLGSYTDRGFLDRFSDV